MCVCGVRGGWGRGAGGGISGIIVAPVAFSVVLGSVAAGSLDAAHDFVDALALLLGLLTVVGNVADGDDGDRLHRGLGKQLAGESHIEVAYPAGAQTALGGSQAEMLGGYGEVYVAVGVAVFGAHPVFFRVLQTDDVEWGSGKPFAVVASAQTGFGVIAFHDDKVPRLAVAGRGSHAHTLHDVVEVGLGDSLVSEASCGEALLGKLKEFHNRSNQKATRPIAGECRSKSLCCLYAIIRPG